MLDIIYQDEYLIAINKPHGLLVHRTAMASDAKVFALQLLRDQVGRKVSPVHRLDRKTGGLLLFAFDKENEIAMQKQFMEGQVKKKYLAVLRGYAPDNMDIDYPLMKDNGVMQEAFTSFVTLKRTELEIPFGKHATSRYSLVEASPTTGRMHQLRKHFAHIFYPIIGDRKHGCNKQNRFFKEQWDMTTMLLHASELSFVHPVSGVLMELRADLQPEFRAVLEMMKFE